ncbi:MAG TPA: hypothetical protein VEC13_01025 [Candidatus Paceibacterota bacterium]|nr:hypothetical protein [Candidatus Paceibacterota bacterium]
MPNNPFEEALKGFKPITKEPEPEAVQEELQETVAAPIAEKEIEVAPTPEPKVWRHPETKLLKEDQESFEALCKLIGLSKRGRDRNRYWRVRDCFDGSHDEDMSYEINRWLGYATASPSFHGYEYRKEEIDKQIEKIRKVKAIVEPLLKRGHEARAVKWLLSRTPEKMKYGSGSREQRLEEAIRSAEKAGKTIEQIAKEHNLEYLL